MSGAGDALFYCGLSMVGESDSDLCRRMVHLRSNILLMNEADSIAYLRKQISIMSH